MPRCHFTLIGGVKTKKKKKKLQKKKNKKKYNKMKKKVLKITANCEKKTELIARLVKYLTVMNYHYEGNGNCTFIHFVC